jgi:formate hydrogenlyase subunit 3/multisubunit Na+/H+ antiporter MnhD subunit
VSLAALAGLPPSPLFVSEILVLWGAADAGLVWVAVVAALLLALGFLGMGHALVEGLAGRPSGRRPTGPRGTRLVLALTCVSVVLLLALTALAHRLPDSTLVLSLFGGSS